ADYGVISVMMAVFSVASIIAFMGVPKGVQRFVSYYRGMEDDQAILGTVWTGLSVVTVSSLILGSVLFLAAPWISYRLFHEPNAVWPLRMVAIVLPFRSYGAVFQAVTDAYEVMEYKVVSERIVVNSVKVLLAYGLVWLGYGYIGASLAFTFAFGFGAFVAAYFAFRVLPSFSNGYRTSYNQIFHYSWPLVMAGLAGMVTGYIDTFMIQIFAGSVAVGLYNAAYPFAKLLGVGTTMFSSIFMSNASKMISSGDTEDLTSLFRTVVKWVAIVTVPLFMVLFAFPRAALSLFGAEYYSMDIVLRVLSIGFLVTVITGPVGPIFEAFNRTKISMLFSAVLAVSNIILNYLIISSFPSRAPLAAAVATTLAFCLNFVLDTVYMKKMLGRQPFRMSVLRVFVASLVAILAVYVLSNVIFAVTPLWFLIFDLFMFGVIYAIVVAFGGVLEEDDRVIVEAVFRKIGISRKYVEKFNYV
ncbi:MAG: oligosaccharide flippase family protein, partial [Halobacteriaceae archaeon]